MSVRHHMLEKYNDVAIGTATTSVIINPIPIGDFQGMSIIFRNHLTAIAFLDMVVQVSHKLDGTAADTPPVWVTVATGTLPVPSALGSTAVFATGQIWNAWCYLRVLGKTSQTASVGKFSIIVGGF